MQAITADLNEMPEVQRCSEIQNLGIAHGWAGILYAIMRWCQASGSPLPDMVPHRLRQLEQSAESFGRGYRWKWIVTRGGQPRYMPGWCNGSAGHVFLWTQAYDVLHDERYLTPGTQAAWNAWEERDGIPNLCCGLAGRAYSLLNMYKHSGDSEWLQRAKVLAEEAAAAPGTKEHPRESLYKGELGVALLAVDLEQAELSSMPFFEQEWSGN